MFCYTELITKDKADDVPSESSDNDDEEENIKYKNIISANSDEEENYPDVLSKISDNEEDDCSQASSLCSEKCLTQEVLTSACTNILLFIYKILI